MTAVVVAVLLGNVVWFGMAFRFFSFQQDAAAKLLVARGSRSTRCSRPSRPDCGSSAG